MDTQFIHGVVPPVVTPVDAEERVEEKGLRRIVEHVITGGVHGILSLGSNGEFFAFDREQQQRALAITMDQTQGRVPVYFGIGSITTRECVAQVRIAEQEKAQAITMLPPMFLAPNEDELFDHFRAVAEATDLPVLLYNNPGRVGNNLSARLVNRLADIPNIVGAKDTSGNMSLTAEYIRLTRSKGFKVMAGKDTMILPSLACGAVGCIASTANIVPQLVVEIYDKFMAGDLAGALEAQFKLAPLRNAFDLASFPVVTKDAANLIGLDVGPSVLPNRGSPEPVLQVLRTILSDLGVLKH
jgi:4-hydroxy-tetrahydrodipicolinate synthase